MHPEVQVTLSSKKRGRIHSIDFLVVIVQTGNQRFPVEEMRKP